MSVPVIPQNLWLDTAGLVEIDAALDVMVEQLARGVPPLPVGPQAPLILKATLTAQGGKKPMRPRQVRAVTRHYSGVVDPAIGAAKPTIVLKPFPDTEEGIRFLAEDLPAFRLALRPLLAHEASHVRQVVQGGHALLVDIHAADAASRKAKRTRVYQDYMDYVSRPIELAAHATQLAVEVIDVHGGGLAQAEFNKRCLHTWVWRHVRDGPRWKEDQQTRLPLFIPVAISWREQAWWIYKRLT